MPVWEYRKENTGSQLHIRNCLSNAGNNFFQHLSLDLCPYRTATAARPELVFDPTDSFRVLHCRGCLLGQLLAAYPKAKMRIRVGQLTRKPSCILSKVACNPFWRRHLHRPIFERFVNPPV